jgi:hypothetical protein
MGGLILGLPIANTPPNPERTAMNRRLTTGSGPLGSPTRLDLNLIARLPAPLPTERAARMVEQRLESWQPADAVRACEQALALLLAPAPAPLAIAARVTESER